MKKSITLYVFFILIIGSSVLSFGCNKQNTKSDNKGFRLPAKAVVMTNQADASIVIVNMEAKQVVWKWTATNGGIQEEHRKWFGNPSEVKPVYNNTCILMTASKGAVALIRIKDKKVLYYAYAGVNPHSAELLPDGNIVTASSTDGLIATFCTDTIKGFGKMIAQYEAPAAHNLYWDPVRKKLYSATHDIFSYDYNGNKENPQLINPGRISVKLPNGDKLTSGHELYPVYGENDKLWLANNDKVWIYDQTANTLTEKYNFYAVKSVSNCKEGVLMLCPSEEWWSDHLIDDKGKVLFRGHGYKIYKARWFIQ